MIDWNDRIIFHPGYYIREIMEAEELNPNEVAILLDMRVPDLIELVGGIMALTPDIAERLEKAFGVSAQTWLNLEIGYRYEQCLKAGYKWKSYQKKEE